MNALMSGYEAQVRAALPVVGDSISTQKQQVLAYLLGGLSMGMALRAVGAKDLTVQKLMEDEVFMKYVNHFGDRHVQEIEFGVTDAHMMLMEAHRKSTSTTEEVMTIKELINLHGLAAPKKQINVNEHHVFKEKDVKRLPEAKLMELAGEDNLIIDIEPEEIEYDGD